MNNIESALKKVKDQKENFGFMDRFTVDENYEVMLALEKQIPKKPIIYFACKELVICGVCNMCSHITRSVDYCPHCGQRIDWGVVEE